MPLYTVAVGGSGGAIQQYVYGQNHPGLLDAGVPYLHFYIMQTTEHARQVIRALRKAA